VTLRRFGSSFRRGKDIWNSSSEEVDDDDDDDDDDVNLQMVFLITSFTH